MPHLELWLTFYLNVSTACRLNNRLRGHHCMMLCFFPAWGFICMRIGDTCLTCIALWTSSALPWSCALLGNVQCAYEPRWARRQYFWGQCGCVVASPASSSSPWSKREEKIRSKGKLFLASLASVALLRCTIFMYLSGLGYRGPQFWVEGLLWTSLEIKT